MWNIARIHAPIILNRHYNCGNLRIICEVGFCDAFRRSPSEGSLWNSCHCWLSGECGTTHAGESSIGLPSLQLLQCFSLCFSCVVIGSLASSASLSFFFLHGDARYRFKPHRIVQSVTSVAYYVWRLWHRHDATKNLKHVRTVHRWCNMSSQRTLPWGVLTSPVLLPERDRHVMEKNIYRRAVLSKNVLSGFFPAWNREYTT